MRRLIIVSISGHWNIVTMRCGGSDQNPFKDGKPIYDENKKDLVGIFVFIRNSCSDAQLEEAKEELRDLGAKTSAFSGLLFQEKFDI